MAIEAERVPARPVAADRPVLRRCLGHACPSGGCDHTDEPELRRSALGQTARTAPPIVHDVLRSPGRSLDASLLPAREGGPAHHFAAVRIHADGLAARSAAAVNARAYTVGDHIVFGGGRFAPETPEGMRLLRHELTHVRQNAGQGMPAPGVPIEVGPANDAAEQEAERSAEP